MAKPSGSRLSINTGSWRDVHKSTFSGDVEEDIEPASVTWQDKLDYHLNHRWLQAAVVIVVLLDVLLLTFLLLISEKVIQTPGWPSSSTPNTTDGSNNGVAPVQHAEDALHYINIVILSVFLIEVLLRTVACMSDIVNDKWQVFDNLVVIVTFCLYVAMTSAVARDAMSYSMGYIIILRMWRIPRLYKAIAEPIHRKAERIVNTHRKALQHAEREAQLFKAKLQQQQRELVSVKEQIKLQTARCAAGQHMQNPYHSNEGSEDELSHTYANNAAELHYKLSTVNGSVHSSMAVQVDRSSPMQTVVDGQSPAKKPGSLGMLPSSDRGSIPDIVEHTQNFTADHGRDNASHAVSHSSTYKTDSGCDAGVGVRTGDAGATTPYSRAASQSVASAECVHNGTRVSEPASDSSSGLSPNDVSIRETEHLVKEAGQPYAYLNPGFTATLEGITPEEAEEIKRISQVPFEQFNSTTNVVKEGIPMTDL